MAIREDYLPELYGTDEGDIPIFAPRVTARQKVRAKLVEAEDKRAEKIADYPPPFQEGFAAKPGAKCPYGARELFSRCWYMAGVDFRERFTDG